MKMKVRNKAALTDEVTFLEKENLKIACEAAAEGIVLLENDGCLPLKPGKIALYGAGAGMTIKGGTGSGEVNERHAVSILEGMEMAGYTVTTKKWIDGYQKMYEEGETAYAKEFRRNLLSLNPAQIMDIMSSPFQYPFGSLITEEEAEDSDTDTCIYVVARQAGEGADKRLDRDEYSLSETEKANIAFCAAKYEKCIVVINAGSSFDMNFLDETEGINAVIFFCQQGTMGGKAFADIVSGTVTPSGKLADTWAQHYEDIPYAKEYSYLNGNVDEEYYREGIFVGYRYFDTFRVTPKYEFGYGLSYTEFSIHAGSAKAEGTKITIPVTVKNIGNTYSGKEVVQLYVSCPNGSLPKEYQKLAAFAKSKELSPGESQDVSLSFKLEDTASFCEETGEMLLEKGTYVIRLGNSSRAAAAVCKIVLEETVTVEQMEHICPSKECIEELVPDTGTDIEAVEEIYVNQEAFKTTVHLYETPKVYSSPETDELLENLSVKELTALTVGCGLGSGAYFHAPGAAGGTTGKLLKKGIPNVSLADGPAGLRLQKRSAVTKSGKIKAVDPFISLMKYIPEAGKKILLGNPEKCPVIYQFTTAFPVGTALAQTWNEELVKKVGDAVGREMERYGVTYWLAPALNIHRNPLCGRNFEYYSEDPLLSGKMAAAITKGVQAHRGCFVTLKHFCCNNQEDNRNKTNANVSERALREIYLKGFEIAVKEAGPGSVMTSYNKVNGVYANNSYDLLTKVLRNEWGFDGLVMTDWFATGKGLGSHALAVAAGNDLIMPGGASAEKEILEGTKNGLICEEDVKRCAANVAKGICQSRIYQAFKKSRK